MNKKKSWIVVFACCVLAMPTCVKLLDGFHAADMKSAVVMGVVLGIVHVVARPVLRVVSMPIGCLTLGLIHPLIDMGLIYACDRFVDGFQVTSPAHALLAVFLINVICFIAAGRR